MPAARIRPDSDDDMGLFCPQFWSKADATGIRAKGRRDSSHVEKTPTCVQWPQICRLRDRLLWGRTSDVWTHSRVGNWRSRSTPLAWLRPCNILRRAQCLTNPVGHSRERHHGGDKERAPRLARIEPRDGKCGLGGHHRGERRPGFCDASPKSSSEQPFGRRVGGGVISDVDSELLGLIGSDALVSVGLDRPDGGYRPAKSHPQVGRTSERRVLLNLA